MVVWLTTSLATLSHCWCKNNQLTYFKFIFVWYPSSNNDLCANHFIIMKIYGWKMESLSIQTKMDFNSYSMVQHNGTQQNWICYDNEQVPFYEVQNHKHHPFMFGANYVMKISKLGFRPKTIAKNLNLVLYWYWFHIKYHRLASHHYYHNL